MTKINDVLLLEKSAAIFGRLGLEGFNIRLLAKEVGISPSVIYHYFENETVLLKAMFDYCNKTLGQRRAGLVEVKNAGEMLKQRIGFQIDNSEFIVAVLKYYLAFRNDFARSKHGFLPDKSTLHIEEVLEYGIKTKEFVVVDIKNDAAVITHAINGFLLEFYPYKLKEKEKNELIEKIYNFLLRALKGGERR